jgi:protein involved in polysaccharide export with SLBB domain
MFAEEAAGHPLPVYGRQLFDEVPTTFSPMDRIPVPANYALGPGDELLIRVWGKVDLECQAIVDRNGQISLPKVGTVRVAGLRYEQVEGYLHSAIGALYKDFELNVTMGQLRSIQIFVLGSARQPGAYTVSSLSTLVDALFASGGPSGTGTMRHIQLRRGDQVMTEFDLYDLLRNGDKSHDVQLLPGDVIYIPSIGPQVAIVGSVNEPGVYELKDATTIDAILKDAGGLTNLAATDRILLERIENHRRRRVDEFVLDASGLQRVPEDGDLLRIFSISVQFENAVTLRGPRQGRFAWREGMRVSDLIASRDWLVSDEHWKRQNRQAAGSEADSYADSRVDSNADSRVAGSQTDSHPDTRGTDSHGGSSARSHADTHVDMMSDISESSAEINWDYAAIERLDEHDLSTRLIAFNLGTALDNPRSSENPVLKAGDVVTVFARKDLALPLEKHATFVQVGGEVNAPGVYRVDPGDTLRDVVRRAGGLTPHSYLYASQLTRVSTRLAQEQQLQLSIARMQKEAVSRFAGAPAVSATGSSEQQTQLGSEEAAITELSSVHPTGRIVLDMGPEARTIEDIPDFMLEDGDSFYVPPRLSTVQVAGAVYNENAFRYQHKKKLSAYLDDAGGPTRQADSRRMFLIRADGTVISRQSHSGLWGGRFEELSLLPGDSVVVPTKLKSPSGLMQQLPFMAQIISQTAMTGAALSAIQ